MCIAKIYTNSKNFKTHSLIDVDTIDNFQYSEDYPILIIGKKNAEEIFGKERVKVLDKTITNNISWTYGKTEKREEYEKDIEHFYKMIYSKINKSVKYVNIDIYGCVYTKIKNFINFIRGEKYKCVFFSDNHVYIYCEKTVIGISLTEIEYCGVKKEKIFNLIKNGKNVIYVKNDFSIINILIKYVNNPKYIVPYVYYLKNQ